MARRKIALKDLFLWDQNARFTDKYFSKPEKELIEHFCSDKKFRIETFAKKLSRILIYLN